MSTPAEAEAKLDKLIAVASLIAGGGEHPHKLVWDLISARDLAAHAHCTHRGCWGFVFIKVTRPLIYGGSAIKDACPIRRADEYRPARSEPGSSRARIR